MSWESLLRIAELAFAAGSAVAYIRFRLDAIERDLGTLRAETRALSAGLKKVRRAVFARTQRAARGGGRDQTTSSTSPHSTNCAGETR